MSFSRDRHKLGESTCCSAARVRRVHNSVLLPMAARSQVVPLISACLRTNDIALRFIINIPDIIIIVINFNIITIIIKYQTILGTLPDKP